MAGLWPPDRSSSSKSIAQADLLLLQVEEHVILGLQPGTPHFLVWSPLNLGIVE